LLLIGPELAFGISVKIARGDWTSRKHDKHWQSTRGQRHAKGFLKRVSGKRAGELLHFSEK